MLSMKKWFKGKLTKTDFDLEARTICTEENVHLHNKFLLCMIRRCNLFSTAITTPHQQIDMDVKAAQTTQKKPKITPANTERRFKSQDPLKYAQIVDSVEQNYVNLEYCSRERLLPYIKMIHGRLLMMCLENDLQSFDLNCVCLIAEAAVLLLKNILTKLIQTHKMHQNRFFYGKNFYYEEFGGNDDENEKSKELRELDFLLKHNQENTVIEPINLFDLKKTLELNKFLLTSHTMYTINMEKIICLLNHSIRMD